MESTFPKTDPVVVPPETSRLERLITVYEVIGVTSLSRTTLYNMIADGRFPKPIKIGRSRIAWRVSVVAEWLKRQERCAA